MGIALRSRDRSASASVPRASMTRTGHLDHDGFVQADLQDRVVRSCRPHRCRCRLRVTSWIPASRFEDVEAGREGREAPLALHVGGRGLRPTDERRRADPDEGALDDGPCSSLTTPQREPVMTCAATIRGARTPPARHAAPTQAGNTRTSSDPHGFFDPLSYEAEKDSWRSQQS